MADNTLNHPKASDLTSTGNDLLKLYRIQKGIHSRNLLDMAMEDSTESSQEAVRWTDQGTLSAVKAKNTSINCK